MSNRATYLVSGMTCSHCVHAVTEELMSLPGVSEVRVELVVGAESPVHVASAEVLDPELVRGAVDEAGYQLSNETS